jgi:uncharacterized protein
VKILCVSDTIMPQLESAANLRRRYNDIELVISCGDMSAAYLEFIISVLNVPLFYVRGNHDEGYFEQPPGGEDLHKRVVKYNGLTFAGLEGSIKYNDGRIQYTEQQMSLMVMGMATSLGIRRMNKGYGLDVLVTHSPPRGIHDAEDRPHNGFKALLQFMRWYRPRYLLHGHVHTYDRRKTTKTQYEETCILNINPFTVIEIDPVS